MLITCCLVSKDCSSEMALSELDGFICTPRGKLDISIHPTNPHSQSLISIKTLSVTKNLLETWQSCLLGSTVHVNSFLLILTQVIFALFFFPCLNSPVLKPKYLILAAKFSLFSLFLKKCYLDIEYICSTWKK